MMFNRSGNFSHSSQSSSHFVNISCTQSSFPFTGANGNAGSFEFPYRASSAILQQTRSNGRRQVNNCAQTALARLGNSGCALFLFLAGRIMRCVLSAFRLRQTLFPRAWAYQFPQTSHTSFLPRFSLRISNLSFFESKPSFASGPGVICIWVFQAAL
jgi:hypothetical protein